MSIRMELPSTGSLNSQSNNMSIHRDSYDPNNPVMVVTKYNTSGIHKNMDDKYNQRSNSIVESLRLDRENKGQECCFAFLLKIENFKEYIAEISCCTWLNNISPFVFLIGSLVLLAALIILPFLIASLIIRGYLSTSLNDTQITEIIRVQPNWPSADMLLQLRSFRSMIPPNVTLCRGYGFSCTNSPSLVIGTLQRCDGVEDCPDGSDEIGCKFCQTTVNCSNAAYGVISSRRSICLRGYHLCDGNVDCPDGSDEKRYCSKFSSKKCLKHEVRCGKTGICLAHEQICDGDVQCKYGEDEKNCKGKCRGGALWCEEKKKCLPKWQICDGIQNCPDGKDEMDCTCRECSGIEKALCNNTNVCIERSQVCDGNEDCPDGDDEVNCPGSCAHNIKEDFIRCRDGIHYHRKYACSGLLDECEGSVMNASKRWHSLAKIINASKEVWCKLEKDEINADNETATHYYTIVYYLAFKVCDGLDHCGDNSDESNCDCTAMKRFGDIMQCTVHTYEQTIKCIPLSQRCDGYEDCPDGEDERNCEKCMNPNAIYCEPSKTCLGSMKRCDGVTDCPDDNDEQRCNCAECKMHGFPIYMCTNVAKCFRRHEVCNPYTQCPNASKVDKLFCASQARQGIFPIAKRRNVMLQISKGIKITAAWLPAVICPS
ncbi:Sortilin-related receptor [Dirofilaria immitis]|nr:Sortilin-related receptor [Dirofilaria immitis]